MPSASVPHPQDLDSPSHAPGVANQAQSAFEAQGHAHNHSHTHAHDHSVPRNQVLRLSGLLAEFSPVLTGVWARVLTTLAMLGVLWMAIFWAFAGNV